MPALTFDEFLTDAPVKKGAKPPSGMTFDDVTPGPLGTQPMAMQANAFTRALASRERMDQIDRTRAARTNNEKDAHAVSLTGRIAAQGLASGTLGPLAMAADAGVGVGRDIAYGGKKLLSKTGIVEPPDPNNYYGDTPWPISEKAMAAARALPDALGLDQPETAGERMVAGTAEGAFSALSPVGAGALLAKLPGWAGRVGNALKQNPVAQTAGGALAGGAAEGVTELGGGGNLATAAGVAGGILPALLSRTGRVTIKSRAGQEAAAGRTLREAATDTSKALQNIDTVGDRTRLADFRHLTTDAAQDPGLAAVSPVLRDWAGNYAGGAVAAVKEHNDSILSRQLDKFGAVPGTAAEARRVQSAADSARIAAMDLPSAPPADVTKMMDEMQRGTNIRRTGKRSEVGKAHGEMLSRMEEGAIPVRDKKGNIIRYEMPLQNLQAARADFSEMRKPGSLTSPNPSSLRHARGETREFMNQIDEELGAATLGEYADYLSKSRRGRNTADAQEFMEDFGQRVNPTGQRHPNKARVINEGNWIAQVENKADKPLPGGNRAVSVDTLLGDDHTRGLHPAYGMFLRDAAHDLNDANYAKRTASSMGSNTEAKRDIKQNVADIVAEGRGPIAKMTDPLLSLVGMGSNAAAKLVTPLAGTAGRAISRFGDDMLTRGATKAETRVRAILGQAEADPTMAARLMRLQPAYNPGIGRTLAIQSGKAAMRAPIQGFLAGERASRYR